MWTKPYSLREGFAIEGGLVLTGLMLQLSVGPVSWDAFAYPVNVIVLAVLLVICLAIWLLRRKVYALQFIGTYRAAIPALVYAVVLTMLMGVTRQSTYPADKDPLGLTAMLSQWSFVLIYLYIVVILSQVILNRVKRMCNAQCSMFNELPFLLNHLGLFIAIVAGTLGNADMQRLKMITAIGEPEWRALDQQGAVRELPIAIELKRFIMEEYDDGSPKRFASDIQILTQSGKNITTTVDVNHPVEVDGWKIYQYGYDTKMGTMSQTSILELVADPCLPVVYTGIYMMLFGAVFMFLGRREGVRKEGVE